MMYITLCTTNKRLFLLVFMEITESLVNIDDIDYISYTIRYEEQIHECLIDPIMNTIRIKNNDGYSDPIELTLSKKHMFAYCLDLNPKKQILIIETKDHELIPIETSLHKYIKENDINSIERVHDVYLHSISEFKTREDLRSIIRDSEDESSLTTSLASTFMKLFDYISVDINEIDMDPLMMYKRDHKEINIRHFNEIIILLNELQYEPAGKLSYLIDAFYRYIFNRYNKGKPILYKYLDKLYSICKKVYDDSIW